MNIAIIVTKIAAIKSGNKNEEFFCTENVLFK